MFKGFNNNLQKSTVEIFVGEYYVTKKQEIILTLLGSCISVCLFDNTNKVYGMNHFLLPMGAQSDEIDKNGRFGFDSMHMLIKDMLRMGASKENLRAKVFGGGKVLKTTNNVIKVNEDNIKFIRDFLAKEGIAVLAEDLGGTYGRKIYFDTENGNVYVKKFYDSFC